jgi:GT2 family glycosyltransferase
VISVIVRTKNEEAWIRRCLTGVKAQRVNHEVEVVLVDNMSSDLTIPKALSVWPDLTLVKIEEFRPGEALNRGIEAAHGDLIVCLSAHCIPIDNEWLSALARNLRDSVAGVYGRQVPMASTSPSDRRDLAIAFGLDRKVQRKDPFFHNANSMIPRAVLDEFPFRSDVTNIEDRLWAEQVLEAGMTIVYEPDAQVFHHHGIHHSNEENRARNTALILLSSSSESLLPPEASKIPTTLDFIGILPVGDRLGGLPLEALQEPIAKTLESYQESASAWDLFVSASNASVAEFMASAGFDVLPLSTERPQEGQSRIDSVIAFETQQIEASGRFPDGVVSLDLSHPNRPPNFFTDLLRSFVDGGGITTCAGFAEFRPAWQKVGQAYKRIDVHSAQRNSRDPIWIALPGLGCVTAPTEARAGRRLGDVVQIFRVPDAQARIEIQSSWM